MSNKLSGSDLTRKILKHNNENVWCAVSNDSDKHAMTAINNMEHDILKYIACFDDSHFLCKDGKAWQYAIQVKKVEMTQEDAGF